MSFCPHWFNLLVMYIFIISYIILKIYNKDS
nr:MAG TPA: hypothetical protein [Caudoviricetes sp.]